MTFFWDVLRCHRRARGPGRLFALRRRARPAFGPAARDDEASAWPRTSPFHGPLTAGGRGPGGSDEQASLLRVVDESHLDLMPRSLHGPLDLKGIQNWHSVAGEGGEGKGCAGHPDIV